MKYYQVKPHADQMSKGIRTKSGFLIKDELFTAHEIDRAKKAGRIDEGFIKNHLQLVHASKKHVYFFFGARKCSEEYINKLS
jgi:hypothetical protein